MAGGAALIVRGDVDRLTRDLDFFTVEPNTVDVLLPAFEAAARKAGLTVVEEQAAHGFARLVVSDGTDQTGVDLASDARLFASEPSELGRILSAEELAVDKVLAVFGRAEARDFVDLAALEPRFGLAHLCELAGRKDTGFRRPVQPRCSTGSIAWTGTSSTSTTRHSPPSSSWSGGGEPVCGRCRAETVLWSGRWRGAQDQAQLGAGAPACELPALGPRQEQSALS